MVTHSLSESEFTTLAERTLAEIEQALEASGADADCSAAGDGVLEIEFGESGERGGERIVINRHVAAREIWLASRSGGLHFRWDGSAWKDTRNGRELMAVLRGMLAPEPVEPGNTG